MGGFSALLIGASAYDEAPLRFVLRDIEKLGEALRERGVRVEVPRPREGRQVTANFVNGEVVGFLARAEPGERLLISLSGHGTHVDGQDYLVPEDIHPELKPYRSGCIAIDWKQELQETAAAQVLFLVDACRQGIRDAMGPPPSWSVNKMRAVAGRKVARLYACAPGELARFVPAEESTAQAGDSSFSLFSRAVREVLVSHEGPLNLDELRAGVQERVSALHREHRKPGRPQEVRVLTEAVHTEFEVAGALRAPVVPVVPVVSVVVSVDNTPTAVPELPQVAKDPAKLMADAVHQVVTTGRTEYLEEFAVVGSAAELLKLSGLAMLGTAVDAMWTAAAHRRPVEPLVELTVALHGADEVERAVWLVGSAVAARPAEDLLGLLDALEAAGLRAQADGLVRTVAAAGDPRTTEHLLVLLAEAGREQHRAAVLSEIAAGPMARLVAWLAAGQARSGFDEDAAFVLRVAVTGRDDRDLLMTELRRIGQDGHLRTVHEAAGHLELPVLYALLVCLHKAGADEDGRAVTRCAVEPLRPAAAAQLAAFLRATGLVDLFGRVLTALCRSNVEEVAEFLLEARNEPDLVGEALTVLAERLPVTAIDRLAAELSVRQPATAVALRQKALDLRPMADLLVLLEHASDARRSTMLEQLASSDRPASELAELVEMPGRPRLRRRTGAQVAACLLARDDSALKGVLAELLGRGWQAGTRLLFAQIVVGADARAQVDIIEWLHGAGHGEHARSLLDRIGEERGAAHQRFVAERLLTGGQPELGMHVAVAAAGTWPTRDLLRLARRPAPEGGATARAAAFLLTRAVQVRTPELAAELLLAVDTEPEEDGPVPVDQVDQLLGEYLTAGPLTEAVPRITHLRDARPGSRVALGVSAWVRAHACALFQEAWRAGSAEAVECLLAVYGDGGAVGPLELEILLTELRGSGGGSAADFVRDTAVRSQRPEVVAAFLTMFQASYPDDFVAACQVVGDRPVAEVASVLVGLAGAAGAVEDSHWTAAVGGLLLDVDRRGPSQIAGMLDGLAAGLDPGRAVELVEHVTRGGATPLTTGVLLRALARAKDAFAVWTGLMALGRFDRAAALLDQAPAGTDVGVWYRDLLASSTALDRSALLRSLGADRPVPEIVASRGPARALLATAVLFRPPAVVAELLARSPAPELRRILGVARPVPELVLVIGRLMECGQRDDAARIVDAVLSDETPARVGELLETTPRHVPGRPVGAIWVVADLTMRAGTTARLVRALLDAGYGFAVERLVDQLTVAATGAKGAAALIQRLAVTGVAPEVRDRLTRGFCEHRPDEAVARFLHHLDRLRAGEDLDQAVAAVAGRRRAGAICSTLMEMGNGELSRRIEVTTGGGRADAPPSKGWFRRKG
ncbi:caspase family protein [Kitasatospora sp. NPDC058162]|uniref:caspase family protein n=1 Tax=Kitasatospora sp. NPDC058162 TaxID=3346362 RepID=UPI0036DB1D78